MTPPIALYALDYGNNGGAETITIQNASTGAVLNTQSISSFAGGEFLQWNISGDVVITVSRTAGPNAVIDGLFIDRAVTAAPAAIVSGAGVGIGPGSSNKTQSALVDRALPALETETPARALITDLVWEQASTAKRPSKVTESPYG